MQAPGHDLQQGIQRHAPDAAAHCRSMTNLCQNRVMDQRTVALLQAHLLSAIFSIAGALQTADNSHRSADVVLEGSIWLMKTLKPFSLSERRSILQHILMCLACQVEAAGSGSFSEGQDVQSRYLSTCRTFVMSYLQIYLAESQDEIKLDSSHANQELPAFMRQQRAGQTAATVDLIVADMQGQCARDLALSEENEQQAEGSIAEPESFRPGRQWQMEASEQPEPSISYAAHKDADAVQPRNYSSLSYQYPIEELQKEHMQPTENYLEDTRSKHAHPSSDFGSQSDLNGDSSHLNPVPRYIFMLMTFHGCSANSASDFSCYLLSVTLMF